MRRSRLAATAAAAVGIAGFAAAATTAGDSKRDFETDLRGYEEVPAVSTVGHGQVDVEVARDGRSLTFELRYRALESAVTQAHIHFGQRDANGGVVLFLCSNLGNAPAGTPPCPQPAPGRSATVTGTRSGADMVAGARDQGIAPGEFDELVRALRAGVAYGNVHSADRVAGEIRGQLGQEGDGDDD